MCKEMKSHYLYIYLSTIAPRSSCIQFANLPVFHPTSVHHVLSVKIMSSCCKKSSVLILWQSWHMIRVDCMNVHASFNTSLTFLGAVNLDSIKLFCLPSLMLLVMAQFCPAISRYSPTYSSHLYGTSALLSVVFKMLNHATMIQGTG